MAMRYGTTLLMVGALLLTSCAPTIPEEALKLSAQSLQQRQIQTKRFDTSDEKAIIAASAAVLQDLGFNLEQSETQLGFLLGTKDRDAMEAGQVVGAVVVAVLFGVQTSIDKNQKIRVSVVSKPIDNGKSVHVRATFQRLVWNTQGHLSKIEALEDPKLYQEFFGALSKSVFLEANEI
jgi:hypothetical protein